MLAHSSIPIPSSGALREDVHRPATFLRELIEFVADQLPGWRDDPERPGELAEDALTEHLCDYLSGVARMSAGWDVLQFRTETRDEHKRGRKIDLAPKPCGTAIVIDGRRYTQYESLMPIECKRLPTPTGAERDEREYVFNKYRTTGGIQRFKSCHHGANHGQGAMIGFVQEESAEYWLERIAGWINDLVAKGVLGWTNTDHLHADVDDPTLNLAILHSVHTRTNGRDPIELRHLWVKMN